MTGAKKQKKKHKRPSALNKWRLHRLTGSIGRLVRRRGFGIHSPFAFDFVRRVIGQPCSFYCYPGLKRVAQSSRLSTRQARLLFRLALHFRPSSYSLAAAPDRAIDEAMTAAAPEAVKVDCSDEFMIVDGTTVDRGALRRLADNGGIAMFVNVGRDLETVGALWDYASAGMFFRGSRTAIFVGRRHLPKQMFEVWI